MKLHFNLSRLKWETTEQENRLVDDVRPKLECILLIEEICRAHIEAKWEQSAVLSSFQHPVSIFWSRTRPKVEFLGLFKKEVALNMKYGTGSKCVGSKGTSSYDTPGTEASFKPRAFVATAKVQEEGADEQAKGLPKGKDS